MYLKILIICIVSPSSPKAVLEDIIMLMMYWIPQFYVLYYMIHLQYLLSLACLIKEKVASVLSLNVEKIRHNWTNLFFFFPFSLHSNKYQLITFQLSENYIHMIKFFFRYFVFCSLVEKIIYICQLFRQYILNL